MFEYESLDLQNLLHICENAENIDSYSVSPTYYLMTGRLGGRIYHALGQSVVVVVHPNAPDVLLVFPAIAALISWICTMIK